MANYVNQTTIQYKTFVKRALVEALQQAWAGHPDPTVSSAKIAIDFTDTDFTLPAVIVKFYESSIPNAGVGHYEWLPYPLDSDPFGADTVFVEYQHRMYKGSIEFEIFGMSSADRDILSDALIDTLAMDEVSNSGQAFINRFYNGIQATPYGQWHFPTLNIDVITGYGETTQLAPWMPEDQLVYQTAYRLDIFGEFYSYTPPAPTSNTMIDEVDVYGYPTGAGPYPNSPGPPIDPLSPAPPVSDDLYWKFDGWPSGEETI